MIIWNTQISEKENTELQITGGMAAKNNMQMS
jgi:hypothetical protein